jgi:hypothetical protein
MQMINNGGVKEKEEWVWTRSAVWGKVVILTYDSTVISRFIVATHARTKVYHRPIIIGPCGVLPCIISSLMDKLEPAIYRPLIHEECMSFLGYHVMCTLTERPNEAVPHHCWANQRCLICTYCGQGPGSSMTCMAPL